MERCLRVLLLSHGNDIGGPLWCSEVSWSTVSRTVSLPNSSPGSKQHARDCSEHCMLSLCLLFSHSSTRHELHVWTCGRLLVTLCVPAVPAELTKPWFRSGVGRRVAVEATTSSAIEGRLTEAPRTMSNHSVVGRRSMQLGSTGGDTTSEGSRDLKATPASSRSTARLSVRKMRSTRLNDYGNCRC